MDEQKKWSAMTPHELLDAAQAEMESWEYPKGTILTITPQPFTRAGLLLQAAQVKAIDDLSWTLENRIAPTIAEAMAR